LSSYSNADAAIPAGPTRILQLADQAQASQIFGAYDINLALIEQRLDVKLAARGVTIEITGSEPDCELAADVLDTLRQRLENGQPVAREDVETALRVSLEPPQQQVDLKSAIGRFAKVATRLKTVEARSSAQDRYIRAMMSHQMVFGVGPAGTGKTFLAVAFAAAMLPGGQPSGLKDALRILRGVKGIEEVKFTAADVVRHELVTRIVAAYDGDDKQRMNKSRDER
jgi:phosphate starvation-inducible protein PhoH